MSFQAAAYLRKATSRAKSDVANKLIGMFLHEVSRKISVSLELNVADPRYTSVVVAKFASSCCYCRIPLENDRAAVEHLDGMNRFQAGLHIPGNVILSCKKCNNEKRRDDQLHELKLAKSGWESFLSHDSTKCVVECKTCAYWKSVWPDEMQRNENLKQSRNCIMEFRAGFRQAIRLGRKAKPSLHQELERLYRECQVFATDHIKGSVEQVVLDLGIQMRR
ncbi:MAG: hypothetical protein ABIR24_09640 [Verrucomicrobiota bacterium]